MKETVERILNLFPEVTWDRFTGSLDSDIGVFGWIARPDGKFDFIMLMIDKHGVWFCSTSSAEHSKDFSGRLGFTAHRDCQRVEHTFSNVNSVKIT